MSLFGSETDGCLEEGEHQARLSASSDGEGAGSLRFCREKEKERNVGKELDSAGKTD